MSEPQFGKTSEEETDGLSESSTCMAKTMRKQARACSHSSSEIDDLPEDKAEKEQERSISSRNIHNVKRFKSAKTIETIKKENNNNPNTKSARKERMLDSTSDVINTKTVTPHPDSQLSHIYDLLETHNWSKVLEAKTSTEKKEIFLNEVMRMVDKSVPIKIRPPPRKLRKCFSLADVNEASKDNEVIKNTAKSYGAVKGFKKEKTENKSNLKRSHSVFVIAPKSGKKKLYKEKNQHSHIQRAALKAKSETKVKNYGLASRKHSIKNVNQSDKNEINDEKISSTSTSLSSELQKSYIHGEKEADSYTKKKFQNSSSEKKFSMERAHSAFMKSHRKKSVQSSYSTETVSNEDKQISCDVNSAEGKNLFLFPNLEKILATQNNTKEDFRPLMATDTLEFDKSMDENSHSSSAQKNAYADISPLVSDDDNDDENEEYNDSIHEYKNDHIVLSPESLKRIQKNRQARKEFFESEHNTVESSRNEALKNDFDAVPERRDDCITIEEKKIPLDALIDPSKISSLKPQKQRKQAATSSLSRSKTKILQETKTQNEKATKSTVLEFEGSNKSLLNNPETNPMEPWDDGLQMYDSSKEVGK